MDDLIKYHRLQNARIFITVEGRSSRQSGDGHPLVRLFFVSRSEKKEVILTRIGFENRFLTMIAALSDKLPPFSDFLGPPLLYRSSFHGYESRYG
jgi:hypothetical protein